MKYFYFVGIDVAKLSFDASIIDSEEKEIAYAHFKNDNKGVLSLLKWIKSHKISLSETLFCAEATGCYISNIALNSVNKKFNLAIACALSIKRSLGITRGKNDKIDALRIAKYSMHNQGILSLYEPEEQTITELKTWFILRENRVKEKVSLSNILSALIEERNLKHNEKQIKYVQKELNRVSSSIKEIEKSMKELIESNEMVKKNYELLNSVIGVGFVTATVMITSTANFTLFTDPRKYACYCGVAPFPHESGTSIRGKTKVSKLANIKIKTHISAAAKTAKTYDPQIKNYYNRKIKENKNKSSVLNAVKNKVIARCFAVVMRGKPYVALQI